MKRFLIIIFLVQIVLSGFCVDVPLYRDTVLRFAGLEEGQQILGSVDDYVRNLSLFQRQVILQSRNPVSEEEFLQFVARQVIEWDTESISLMTVFVRRAAAMLEKLDLNLPNVIYLIKTTGMEHNDFWYTRQNAIIAPESYIYNEYLGYGNYEEYILVHELFHIFSRYNPAIRDELYSILGYHPCGAPILYPDSLIKLTNPDAPVIEHYINVLYRGESLKVVPIYYSSRAELSGGNLNSYFQYGFMAVVESNEGWTYQQVNDEPLILEESELEGYWDQVGENTDYDIHPEERMAENFRFLCSGRPGHYRNLPTLRIIEAMDAILAGPRQYPELVTEPLREFTDSLPWVQSMGFSEDGTRILICFSPYTNQVEDANITTWDAASGLQLDTFSVERPDSSEFSPDGTTILLTYFLRIELWNIRNKEQVYMFYLPQDSNNLLDCAFSPDGSQFLTTWSLTSWDPYDFVSRYYVTFWDTASGLEFNTFPIHDTDNTIYSPDASQVFIGRTLYDAQTGQAMQRFEQMDYIGDAAFSPDGAQILIAEILFIWGTGLFGGEVGIGGAARLWNTATGEELRSFAFSYPYGVSSVQFSPDGKWILTAGDNTASLWDATGENEIRVFQHPETWPRAMFSPDSNSILTSCDDNIVRLWDISDLAEPTVVDEWYLY